MRKSMCLDELMNKRKGTFTPKEKLMRKIYCQDFPEVLYFIDNQSNNFETAMLNVKKIIKKCIFFGLKVIIKSSSKNYLICCNLISKSENTV